MSIKFVFYYNSNCKFFLRNIFEHYFLRNSYVRTLLSLFLTLPLLFHFSFVPQKIVYKLLFDADDFRIASFLVYAKH